MKIFPKRLNSFIIKVSLAVILVFFFFLFNFRITDVPPGINGDEAAIGYNAALVAKTGYDQSGRFLPLFVSAFDLTDWKQPVTFYSTVLAFKIFGTSFETLRGVSVFFVLLSSVLIFYLAKDLFGIKGAFVSLVIFLTIPAVLIQSHLALENIAPVPFTALWLWMIVRFQKTFKQKYLLLAALFLGAGLFTYPGMRLIVPVYALLTAGFVYYLNRKKSLKENASNIIKFVLIIAFFFIVLFSVKNLYPGALLAYNRPQGIKPYQELILPYISSFDLSFLFIRGDSTPYHSTGKQGVFLLATLPFFALGILKISRRNEPVLSFILLVFFLTPVLYGLAASFHRGSRLLVLLPLFTIISTAGFLWLLEIKQKICRNIIIFLGLLILILNYQDFLRDYWYEYPNRVKPEFSKPYQIVFSKALALSRTGLEPYIQKDFRMQNQVAVDFFEQAYFKDKLKVWSGEEIPKGSVIIVSDYILSQRKDIRSEKVGLGEFGVLINESKQ